MVGAPNPLQDPTKIGTELQSPVGEPQTVSPPPNSTPTNRVQTIWNNTQQQEVSDNVLTTTIVKLKDQHKKALEILKTEYSKKGYSPIDWLMNIWKTWSVNRAYTPLIVGITTALNKRKNDNERSLLADGVDVYDAGVAPSSSEDADHVGFEQRRHLPPPKATSAGERALLSTHAEVEPAAFVAKLFEDEPDCISWSEAAGLLNEQKQALLWKGKTDDSHEFHFSRLTATNEGNSAVEHYAVSVQQSGENMRCIFTKLPSGQNEPKIFSIKSDSQNAAQELLAWAQNPRNL